MADFAEPNFADLCLADRLPARSSVGSWGDRDPARLEAAAYDKALSPTIGIVNSVLIGALVWIGIVAAITLI